MKKITLTATVLTAWLSLAGSSNATSHKEHSNNSDNMRRLIEQVNETCPTADRTEATLHEHIAGEIALADIAKALSSAEIDPEARKIFHTILCSPEFKNPYYEILKKEKAWEASAVITAIILGLLYGIAYGRNTLRIWRDKMPIDPWSFSIFGGTSGGMTWLNGLIPGSIVYAESFVLAFANVILHLRNGKYHQDKEAKEEKAFEVFTDNLPWPAVRYNAEGFPVVWNKKMEEETGYTREEIREYYQSQLTITSAEERPFIIMRLLYKGENLKKVEEYLKRVIHGQWYTDAAFTMTTKSGEEKTFLWNTFPDGRGGNIRIARLLTDPVEIQSQLQKMEKLLREDSLTGAKNRRAWTEDIHTLLTRPPRAEDQNMLVAIIDIDNFKQINDIRGHDVGDRILKEVVTFVESCLRPWDELYRIGGDEFAVRLRGDAKWIYKRCHTIRQGLHEKSGVGTSWGLMPFDIAKLHDPTLTIEGAESKFKVFKETADKYMYAVKYYRLIEAELIASWQIKAGQEPKNGIALPIYHPNEELSHICVRNDYGEFMVTKDELDLISARQNPETVARKKRED